MVGDRPFGADGRPWHLAIGASAGSVGLAGSVRSRVGGNPPECFHEGELVSYLETHRYLLTLSDEFMELTGGRELSVLVPADVAVQRDYPDCEVACLLHPPSPVSASAVGRLDEFGEGSLVRYEHDPDPEGAAYFIKVGGSPDFIQEEPDLYERKLIADGFSFVFQLDEFGYPDDFMVDTYPFGFGGLYVYGKFAEDGALAEVVAGYVQF